MRIFKLANNQQGYLLASILLVCFYIWLVFVSELVGAGCPARRRSILGRRLVKQGAESNMNLTAMFSHWKPSRTTQMVHIQKEHPQEMEQVPLALLHDLPPELQSQPQQQKQQQQQQQLPQPQPLLQPKPQIQSQQEFQPQQQEEQQQQEDQQSLSQSQIHLIKQSQQQQQQQQPRFELKQQQQQTVQRVSEKQQLERQESTDCSEADDIDDIFLSDDEIRKRKEQKAAGGEQHGNRSQFEDTSGLLARPVVLKIVPPPKPDVKLLNELKPGDDLAKYLFNSKEPRWMHACPRKFERNESLANIPINMVPLRTFKVDLEARRERGNFIKQVVARRNQSLSPLTQQELEIIGNLRRKRSISSSSGVKLYKLNKGSDPERGTMLVKQPPAIGKGKWSTKKTSFSLSNMKYHHSKAKKQYLVDPNQLEQAVRLREMTTTTTPTPTLGITTETPEQAKITSKIQNLTISLFNLDHVVTWRALDTLNTLLHAKNSAAALRQAIKNSTSVDAVGQASVIDSERVDEIVRAKRLWMPHLDDLVLGDYQAGASGEPRSVARAAGLFNVTGGFYDSRLKALMVNLTHYVEFFTVALEQIHYDQDHFVDEMDEGESEEQLQKRKEEQGVVTNAKNLNEHILKMLCQTERLFESLDEFRGNKSQFDELHTIYQPKSMTILPAFYKELLAGQLDRLKRYTGGAIDSAIGRAFVPLPADEKFRIKRAMVRYAEKARMYELERTRDSDQIELDRVQNLERQRDREWFYSNSTVPVHIWREIMPLEQRQLYHIKERAVRDELILDDLEPLIDCYESLLVNNLSRHLLGARKSNTTVA